MNLAFKLALMLFSVLTVSCQQCKTTQKLPQFLGKGYDITIGNPLTNGIDPGFQYQIIELQYSDKRSQNGMFLIPNNISFERGRSCSFKADTSQYRGTQSYQKQLGRLVKPSIKGILDFFSGAFTASYTFDTLQKKILKEDRIIYQAFAECTSYKLKLDRYQKYGITKNFGIAILDAVKYNDWQALISQYGTHYVTQVTLGGRAVQQTQLSRNSVASLNTNGNDIHGQISIGFSQFFGIGIGGGQNKNNNDTNSVETLKLKRSNYYIGGKPPRNGQIPLWQQQVDAQPMPIKLQISSLSDLFGIATGKPPIWVDNATKLFMQGIKRHCLIQGCKTVTPDRQLPKRTPVVAFAASKTYGGNGGNAFQFDRREAGYHITRFYTYSDVCVNAIQFDITSAKGDTQMSPDFIGTTKGQYSQSKPLQPGQYISQLYIKASDYITQLGFKGSKGTTFSCGSAISGKTSKVVVPQGYRLTGMGIRAGWYLDSITFYFTKNQLDYTYTHQQQYQQQLQQPERQNKDHAHHKERPKLIVHKLQLRNQNQQQ